jgi:hypothetical protein
VPRRRQPERRGQRDSHDRHRLSPRITASDLTAPDRAPLFAVAGGTLTHPRHNSAQHRHPSPDARLSSRHPRPRRPFGR